MDYQITNIAEGCAYVLSGRLTFRDNDDFQTILKSLHLFRGRRVVLDMAALEYMDSFGIGLMVSAREEAQSHNVRLVLAAARPNVRELLDHLGLSGLFDQTSLASHESSGDISLTQCKGGVAVSGRLVMASQGAFLPVIAMIGANAGGDFVIDLAGLTFMDSLGLSLIMVAHDEARKAGVALTLANPVGQVRELLRVSAVDLVMAVEG